MQSSCAHDVLHYTVQALRAREKRAVVLPHAFGLLASVAGWTFAKDFCSGDLNVRPSGVCLCV